MKIVDNGILVEALVREYKGGIRAVDGIDLEVAPGEIYGFLGPNGAGKSTTTHVLTTLLPPTAGRAVVGGFDVATQGPDVRRRIGAALQEAALDAFLTGREHMDLQGGLHGLSKADRDGRGRALLERVGLTEAADRKVGGYSGGMKRRLDLALALVHEPAILFLDEPTTGLDPQSRSALWDEVARLAREDGVTVFLTTQYLEEADVLAGRVGIIDRGRLVAEGTPDALKREIGGNSVEAVPANPDECGRAAAVLARFGEPAAHASNGAAVRLRDGPDLLPEIVRALDADGIRIAHLELHPPSFNDVFLAKTGRSLEGAGDDETTATPTATPAVVAYELGVNARDRLRRPPLPPAHPPPARADRAPTLVFPLFLLAVNASGLSYATKIPGFPTDSYLEFAITVPFIQGAIFAAIAAGTELATDVESGFLNRLQLTPLRRTAILAGQLAGATAVALIGALAYLAVGLVAGVSIHAGVLGAIVLVLYAVFAAVAFSGVGAALGARTGSAQAVQGAFPLIFVFFFLSSMNLPRNLRRGLHRPRDRGRLRVGLRAAAAAGDAAADGDPRGLHRGGRRALPPHRLRRHRRGADRRDADRRRRGRPRRAPRSRWSSTSPRRCGAPGSRCASRRSRPGRRCRSRSS